MMIFGHRGASGVAPENTLASFSKALEAGADGIECDVHMTADKEIVICHDYTIERTSNGTGWIKDLTLYNLKKYDFGLWFSREFKGEKIITLDELLAWVKRNKLIINIEIKNGPVIYEGIEEKVVDLIYKAGLGGRIIISSFYHPSLVTIKKMDAALKTGALFACYPLNPLRFALDTGADFLHPSCEFVQGEWIKKAKALGLGINCYTVNTLTHFKMLNALGIDGVFTDFPDKLRS